jgi:hypothetical protein
MKTYEQYESACDEQIEKRGNGTVKGFECVLIFTLKCSSCQMKKIAHACEEEPDVSLWNVAALSNRGIITEP